MRLIDADALEKEIRIYAKTLYQNVKYSLTKDFRPSRDFVRGVEDGYCRIISALKSQPTIDTVEVVWCKDCRWWERDYQPRYHPDERPCNRVGMGTPPDWFCADGERRDDE